MAEKVGSIYYDLDLQDDKFNRGMDQAEVRTKSFGKTLQGLEMISKGVQKAMAGIGLGLVALTGMAVKSAMSMETMGVALKTAMGGNEKATKKAQAAIVKFAAKTPYELQEVQTAFIKLKNMGLDPSEKALAAYGDTASAMGKSLNDMVEAVADATTGEFERLKEFGIKASQNGDKVTFTFKGVKTTVKKDSKSIEQYLIKLGKTNFGGGMEAQSKTLAGAISTMKDTISLALGQLAMDSGLLDILKNAVFGITSFVEANAGKITAFFKDLSGAVKTFSDIISGNDMDDLAIFEQTMGSLYNEKLIEYFYNIRDSIGQIGKFIGENKDTLGVFANNLFLVTTAVVGLSIASSVLTGIMVALASPLVPIIAAVLTIAAAMTIWQQNMFGVQDVAKQLWSIIGPILLPAFEELKNTVMNELVPALQTLWNMVQPYLIPALKVLGIILGGVLFATLMIIVGAIWVVIKVVQLLIKFFMALGDAIYIQVTDAAARFRFFWSIAKDIFGKIKGGIDGVAERFRKLPDWIKDAVKNVANIILGPFKTAFDSLAGMLNKAREDLDKLNPFHRESPSLVDWVHKGTKEMIDTYEGMFDRMSNMSTRNRVGLTNATRTLSGQTAAGDRPLAAAAGSVVNVNLSGVMTSSQTELRNVAERIVQAANEAMVAKGAPPLINPRIKR